MSKNNKKIFMQIGIILICILLNFGGKLLAGYANLPVWLDMTGTCVAAYFVGLSGGIITGVASNLLYGFMNVKAMAYILTSIVFAVAFHYCVKKGYIAKLSMALVSSFWLGVLCMVVSTPLNFILHGGRCGNMWGDALYDMLDWHGVSPWLCSVAGEAIVEIVDKQVCVFIAFIIIQVLLKIKKFRRHSKKLAGMMIIAVIMLGIINPVDVTYAKEDEEETFVGELYNNRSGLISSEANVVEETEDGCIWIGSYAGLTRYDGRNFEFLQDSGIANVTAMMTDSKNRLWIGTNDRGIARYENGAFTFFTTENGLPSDSIRCFTESEDGTVYVGTMEQICKFESDDQITVVNDQIAGASSMVVYEQYLVGIDGTGALFWISQETQEIVGQKKNNDMIYNVVRETSRGLLLGTSGSDLYRLDFSNDTVKFHQMTRVDLHDIAYMEEDKVGNLWICGNDGFGYIDTSMQFQEQHYEDFDGSFEWIHVDYQGNIWLASSRQGVLKMARNQFSNIFEVAGIESATVNAVIKYQGDMYCATDSGLYILKEDSYEAVHNDLTETVGNVRVRCLMEDSRGLLWIGTYGSNGLLCWDGKTILDTFTMEKHGTTSDRFRCLLELEDGTIAAGTSDGLNFIRDGKVVGTLTAEDGLENTQILSMVLGENGLLYIGSDGAGIYLVDEQDYQIKENRTKADNLSSNVILRMIPYDNGYFIVTGNGLCYMEDGTIRYLDEFPYFNNYDVIVRDGEAFVLSSAGIFAAKADDIISGEPFQYQLYDVSMGLLPGLTVNSWSYIDDNGDMFLCGNSGVIRFRLWEESYIPDFKYGITSVVCDGVELPAQDDIYQIPEKAKKISIEGSVKNYAMSNVKVRFYIEGLEDNAQVMDYDEMQPIMVYNLSYGDYRVHFQILDNNGENMLEEKIYTLHKDAQIWEKDWYQSYLFAVCVELLVFATWTIIMTVGYFQRKRRQEEQYQENEKRLKEEVTRATSELQQSKNEIKQLLDQTIMALSFTVDAKDRYTSGHSRRVAEYARMIARKMGKNEAEQEEIYYAGLLHDVGKIRVPDEIINKPGKLTAEEFNYIKLHPVAGYHILRGISENSQFSEGAHYHHERYDGKGYPNGLAGDNIPEIGRIIGVADAYDAMASDRSYRKALPQSVVKEEIEKGKGTQFDPDIADVMLELIEEDSDYQMKQTETEQKNILVVDDDRINVKMVEMAMRDENRYCVCGAAGGQEALDILEKKKIDLILLDVEMPGMDGFETLVKIREKYDVPVVFMTADRDLSTIKKASGMGGVDYLTKPFLPMALKEVIHGVMNMYTASDAHE